MRRVFAFIAVLALAASCAKEPMVPATTSNTRVFTATYSDLVKTTLSGLTPVWKSGDEVWLSDGTNSEVATIPAKDDGQATTSLTTTTLTGSTVYAVYPASAASGYIKGGKIAVKVPNSTDGSFGSANVCIAETTGSTLTFKNATAIIKLTKSSADVTAVSISCPDSRNLAGCYEMNYDDMAITAVSNYTSSSITATLAGEGPWYVAINPLTIASGMVFTFTDSSGDRATRTTASSNTFTLNKIKEIDLDAATSGLVFESGWKGSGTYADPYLIANAADLDRLASEVNGGDNKSGKYFQVVADFTTSADYTPIGNSSYGFQGALFNGDNHTITFSGSFNSTAPRIGLFGNAFNSSSGCTIQNVNVAGTVTVSNDDVRYYGSVCAYAGTKAIISHCSSSVNATVNSSGLYNAGGVVGYATCGSTLTTSISHCTNTGTLDFTTGDSSPSFAGVCGGSYYSSSGKVGITYCANTGNITGTGPTACVAGIIASSKTDKNVTVMYCYNWGNVTARSSSSDANARAGGINYNCSSVSYSYNAGTVKTYYGAGYANEGTHAGGLSYSTGGTVSNCYYLAGAAAAQNGGTGGTFSSCNTFEDIGGEWKVSGGAKTLLNALGTSYYQEGNVAPYFYPIFK
ncbi:MAG: hypothetical protein IKX45_01450 [Bacteroidales bacterium]|nr:hypothetical protein [Bacteroidales bacterium]